MTTTLNKRQKIIVLFSLGIACPSIILGYLAFRGIQNDKALLEKERLIKHRQIAQMATNSVADSLTKIEKNIQQIVLNNSRQDEINASLSQVKLNNSLVEDFFVLNKSLNVTFPFANLPYTFGDKNASSTTKDRDSLEPEEVRLGQQFEFQQKDYDKALIQYRQALGRSFNNQLKCAILNKIARVQKKAGNNLGAMRTYESIIKKYDKMFTQNGLAITLSASFKLGSLYLTRKDTAKALHIFMDLYKDINKGELGLDQSQYIFNRNKIRENINQILHSSNESGQFKEQLKLVMEIEKTDEKIQQQIKRLAQFHDYVSKNQINKILVDKTDSPANWNHLDFEEGNYLASVLTKPFNNHYWGYLLNQNILLEKVLSQTLNSTINAEPIGWIVKGKDGQPLLKSESDDFGLMTVRTNFQDNFPPWTLELYQNDPLIDKFLFSSRSIYFYMFLLIGSILLFGLLLSIRTVTHELQLAKMKSDFVSTISHEFKSPLTSIRQISEMLRNKRVPSENRREQYYDILVEQSDRLTSLINNILDFSKLDEGKRKFKFELVQVTSYLEEVVKSIQHQLQNEDVTIKLNIDKSIPTIKMDKSAITQAITNLIDNAIKYSGNRKEILVSGFFENKQVQISVQDYGNGIRPEEKDKIFERFYRSGEQMTRSTKGSGLGLTIVKQIIDSHHGSIDVTSELGKGSIFTIRLPV